VNVWIDLPLALVSALIGSWTYVREQSAVAVLCAISLRHPHHAVRALVRTRALLVGFAGRDQQLAPLLTALRLAPLALVPSVAASGIAALALLQALRGRLTMRTEPPCRAERRAGASSVAPIARLSGLPASFHRTRPSRQDRRVSL
jgi:hypothetical protein